MMQFDTDNGTLTVALRNLIVAGWTGRDPAAVQHHIDELAALGIAPPSRVPLFYRVGATLAVQTQVIDVLGEASSGEVEPVLIGQGGELWLGLGSDHTDRDLEAQSVAASKQACPKPIGAVLWRFSDVAEHLDQIAMTCEIDTGDGWLPYQSGSIADIRPLAALAEAANLQDGDAMLCGTLPAIGGVRPARGYRMKMTDPVRERCLTLEYRVRTLPVIF